MAVTHYYDGRIVILTVTGAVTEDETRAALHAVSSDARLAGVPALVDARSCVERFEDPGGWIEQLVSLPVASRCAIVGCHLFGTCATCRAFTARADGGGLSVQVFHELGGALRWLWRLDDGTPRWPCASRDPAGQVAA